MRKMSMVTVFLLSLVFSLSAQQIPPNWDINPPRDTENIKYTVAGSSDPAATEQAAFESAFQNAGLYFASSAVTSIKSRTEITERESGRDSDIGDVYTEYMQTATFLTQVPLTGVEVVDRKTTRGSNGTYTVKVLATMSAANYQKAVQYADNEETAFLAYRTFSRRVPDIRPLDPHGKPSGYPDFFSWLRNECITISFNLKQAESDTEYLRQIDLFCGKLYRNSTTFAETIDGVSARIIYDSPRYYEGIQRNLQDFAMFAIARESSILKLTPKRASALNDFRTAVANMKDASKIFVTGIEIIQTENGSILNDGNLVVTEFKKLAAKFNLSADSSFKLPAEYTGDTFLDEAAIIDYIKSTKTFPARYVALITAETRIDHGVPEYKIKPSVTANARFTIYDLLTDYKDSGAATTRGSVSSDFVLPDTQDKTVIARSKNALRFLYDVKNQPGLIDSMKEVLGKL